VFITWLITELAPVAMSRIASSAVEIGRFTSASTLRVVRTSKIARDRRATPSDLSRALEPDDVPRRVRSVHSSSAFGVHPRLDGSGVLAFRRSGRIVLQTVELIG